MRDPPRLKVSIYTHSRLQMFIWILLVFIFFNPFAEALSLPTPNVDLLEPTHRGLYRFVPRHQDEIEIDIGDPIYVQREAEDLWCEGTLYSLESWREVDHHFSSCVLCFNQ